MPKCDPMNPCTEQHRSRGSNGRWHGNPASAMARVAACAVAGALLLAGCGGGDTGKVSMSSDTGPKGDPQLVKGDAASGPQDQRVPITSKGTPTAVYQAPVRDIKDGMRLRAIAAVTLTKCEITDYIPNNRGHTACQGTRKYTYDPVEIKTSIMLVGGDKEPDLSGPSKQIGETQTYRCTTAIHHCTLYQDEETVLDQADLGGADPSQYKWAVLEARATSPKAKGCKPPTARDCNVLAVETQKGTAMYWIQADGDVPESSLPEPDRTAAVKTLKVLPNKSNKNKVRRVVYSIELGAGESVDSLQGEQFEIEAKGRIRERLPQAPDLASYIVFSDSPTGIKGRFLISDSYDPGKTGNAGGNCDTSCSAQAGAAITTILPCDVAAGRRYVNVVSAASRMAAKPGETVDVLPGGFLEVTHAYPADASEDPPGQPGSCSARR